MHNFNKPTSDSDSAHVQTPETTLSSFSSIWSVVDQVRHDTSVRRTPDTVLGEKALFPRNHVWSSTRRLHLASFPGKNAFSPGIVFRARVSECTSRRCLGKTRFSPERVCGTSAGQRREYRLVMYLSEYRVTSHDRVVG